MGLQWWQLVSLRHIVTRCNTLQHTATHCNAPHSGRKMGCERQEVVRASRCACRCFQPMAVDLFASDHTSLLIRFHVLFYRHYQSLYRASRHAYTSLCVYILHRIKHWFLYTLSISVHATGFVPPDMSADAFSNGCRYVNCIQVHVSLNQITRLFASTIWIFEHATWFVRRIQGGEDS